MIKKISLACLLTLITGCAGTQQKIFPQEPNNTAKHFMKVCQDHKSNLCTSFMSGYLAGQESVLKTIKKYEPEKEKECAKGNKGMCEMKLGALIDKLQNGCQLQAYDINIETKIKIVSEWIRENPEFLTTSFGNAYSEAIANLYCNTKTK